MHVGSSSLTGNLTQAPCLGSVESYPLHHQGSPKKKVFNENSLKSLWDNIKDTNIRIIGIPEGEERQRGQKCI